MKLLFDQNLSPRLPSALADLFPGPSHVSSHNLDSSSDSDVWQFALLHDYAIVSKDSDFVDRATLDGPRPKIIALTLGDCSTSQIQSLPRMRRQAITDFADNPTEAVLFLP
jgi:predicted nuclease of predicted toxin-antitoxin system